MIEHLLNITAIALFLLLSITFIFGVWLLENDRYEAKKKRKTVLKKRNTKEQD